MVLTITANGLWRIRQKGSGERLNSVTGRWKHNVGVDRSICTKVRTQYGIKQNKTYKSFASHAGLSFSHVRPQVGDILSFFRVVAVHIPNVFLYQVQDGRVGKQNNLKAIE